MDIDSDPTAVGGGSPTDTGRWESLEETRGVALVGAGALSIPPDLSGGYPSLGERTRGLAVDTVDVGPGGRRPRGGCSG